MANDSGKTPVPLEPDKTILPKKSRVFGLLGEQVTGYISSGLRPKTLTNRTGNGDNSCVASPQHVGLWRSLGARFHGMEEVVGSIPTRSTKLKLPT